MDANSVKHWRKIDNVILEMKTFITNFKNVASELENVLSEYLSLLHIIYVESCLRVEQTNGND